MIALIFLAAAFGYLFGSIPFGLLLARGAGLGDVRKIGSGNIGATNVLRTGSTRIAALTLLCDVLKGALPVALAAQLWGAEPGFAAAYGAVAGHVFPVWLNFKGGKGVATYIGALIALAWPLAAAFLAIWLIVAVVSRRSSLAALAGVIVVPGVAFAAMDRSLAIALVVLGIVIFITHRENVSRLLRGTEPPIEFGRKAP